MSEQSGYPGAPPGWYPDPAGGSGQRWWDGYAWTDTVVVPQLPPPPQAWTAPPPQGAPPWSAASERLHAYNTSGFVAAELTMAPAARVALGVPALAGILVLLVVRMQSSQMLQLGQDFKVAYDDAQRGVPTPTFTNGTFSPWFFALLLITVAGLVVSLVWQRRAATAARSLGFPSDYSPAWGVGSWFVPVVNYWFPYLALRDCLPPGHPHRPLVLQWWLAFAVGGSLGFGAFVAGFFSAGVAVGLSIPAALLFVAAMALAPRVVVAITVAHREALRPDVRRSAAGPARLARADARLGCD